MNHTKQKSWPQRLLALLAAVVLCAVLPAAALAEENTASIQTQVSETDEDMQTLKELALANDSVRVINGRQAITYRYVVPGMLLNDPVFTGLTEQNSTAG